MLVEFCIPAYNEEKNLENNTLTLLTYLNGQNFNFNWKIVLVINGSSDNSEKIAENLAQKYSEIKSEINKLPGRGQALKTYFLKSSADVIAYMDADLAVSLDNISDLINPIINGDYDLAIGSRLMTESKIDRSFIRELSSQAYNFLSRVILKHHISDMQCGFKAIKKDVFIKIAPYIEDNKWFFDTELITFANNFKYKIKEIPVDWQENRYEERTSKVKIFRDSMLFIKNLIKLKNRLKQINKARGNI
jgi:glycosyltransferase involved in cell wall biosynthesis